MDEQEYALEWLRFAEMDMGSARHLLTYKPLPIEVICYLCQQSAEKCLKALLVLRKIAPPKIHDLEKLYELCRPVLKDTETVRSQCNILNQYSVQPRYPHEDNITGDDVDEAVKSAGVILEFTKKYFL